MSKFDSVKARLDMADYDLSSRSCRKSLSAMFNAAEVFGGVTLREASPEAKELQKRATDMIVRRLPCLREGFHITKEEKPMVDAATARYRLLDIEDEKPRAAAIEEDDPSSRRYRNLDLDGAFGRARRSRKRR